MTCRIAIAAMLMLSTACGKDAEPPRDQPADDPAPEAPTATPPVAEAPSAPSDRPAARPPGMEAAPVATASRELESLGYAIEVPEGWSLRQVNEHAYAFRIPPTRAGGVAVMSQLAISKRPTAPTALADMARECAGTVVDQSGSEGGPLYYVCEQSAGGQTIRNVEYVMPVAGGALYCSGSGADIAPMLEACKSLAPE